MTDYLFFDNASTTCCSDAAATALQTFSCECFGNPSSGHALGQQSAQVIREARRFFADTFRVEPSQVIFTGSGTEADNLAVYGVTLAALAKTKAPAAQRPPRVLVSAIEHPAVRKTALSLTALGIDVQLIPVDHRGQIRTAELERLLTPETILVSIMRVNNIMGAVLPVTELAETCKRMQPGLVFHCD